MNINICFCVSSSGCEVTSSKCLCVVIVYYVWAGE